MASASGSPSRPSARWAGRDLGVARRLRLVVGGHHDVAGPHVKRPKPWIGSRPPAARGLGHEALLGRLLGDAHAAADVGPRRARAASLVDEVPDEVVGDVAEVVGGEHGVGELVEHVGVDAA